MAKFTDLPDELLLKIAEDLIDARPRRRQKIMDPPVDPGQGEDYDEEAQEADPFDGNAPWNWQRTRLLRYRLVSRRFKPIITGVILDRSNLAVGKRTRGHLCGGHRCTRCGAFADLSCDSTDSRADGRVGHVGHKGGEAPGRFAL